MIFFLHDFLHWFFIFESNEAKSSALIGFVVHRKFYWFHLINIPNKIDKNQLFCSPIVIKLNSHLFINIKQPLY